MTNIITPIGATRMVRSATRVSPPSILRALFSHGTGKLIMIPSSAHRFSANTVCIRTRSWTIIMLITPVLTTGKICPVAIMTFGITATKTISPRRLITTGWTRTTSGQHQRQTDRLTGIACMLPTKMWARLAKMLCITFRLSTLTSWTLPSRRPSISKSTRRRAITWV